MPPRLWSRQLFLIPIAFLTVWVFFSFITTSKPPNYHKEDDLLQKRMQIVDNIRIDQPKKSVSSSKVPYVIPNANYIKDVIKSKKSRIKDKSKGSSPSLPVALRNINQSAIHKNTLTINDIKRIISNINSEQKVLNAEKFNPKDTDVIVIVVQVHNRKTYLEYLINSLRSAYGISSALLIFSHDFFDEDINNLIATIEFCRVMQIFYPVSVQLTPNKFPGTDPKDCPPDMPREQATAISCQNAYNTDSYGHYRNAKIVQLKHHWWWKANIVFNLQAVRNYKGPVIFLEEDLFVVEDFIIAMKLMHETAQIHCKSCKILTLAANQDATFTYRPDFTRSSRATVKSQFSNMGLAFTAETWKEMQECAHVFCKFDDYNWDVTMQHVFTTCMKNTAAMTLSAPRVFHLGSCGTHHTSQNCDSTEKIREIHDVIRRHHNFLYPKKLDLQFDVDHRRSEVFYGGWGDARDQGLCLQHVIKI